MISATRFVSSKCSRLGPLFLSIRHAHRAAELELGSSAGPSVEDAILTPGDSSQSRPFHRHRPPLEKLQEPTSSTHKESDGPQKLSGLPGSKRTFSKPHPKSKYSHPLARQSAIRPAVQSARIKDLAKQGKFDEAVKLVYTAPRRTLNTSTWNTLLSVLMDAEKRKEAYKAYIEVRKPRS